MSNEMFRLLVVDDDPSIRQMLSLGLSQEKYEMRSAVNGESALACVTAFDPHIILLDVMMPVMDGYEFLEALRDISAAAVIMLTAKDATADIVKGLRLGANDYLVKPFHFDELLARIEVQLRQRFPDMSGIRHIGAFVVNDLSKTITYAGTALALSPTEYRLLSYFLNNPNQILSKDKILLHVWGYDYEGNDNVIEVFIRCLREKLGDSDHSLIQTQRGMGYRLMIQA